MFPFLWIGAIVAALFLLAVLAVFGLVAKALSLVGADDRSSIVPGLVTGFRDWAREGGRVARRIASPRSSDGPTIEDLPVADVPTRRPHLQAR